MDVEQAGITGRTERLDAQAAGFLTRRLHDSAERLLHRALLSRARMKPREDEQFHVSSSIERAAFSHRTRSSVRGSSAAGMVSPRNFVGVLWLHGDRREAWPGKPVSMDCGSLTESVPRLSCPRHAPVTWLR